MGFFGYIKKHHNFFFWFCVAYFLILFIPSEFLEWPDWAVAVSILPLNLISWPMFIGVWKGDPLLFRAKGRALGLALASVVVPITLLLGI